jgi:hypothetical protein
MSTNELALHVEAANAHHAAQALLVGRDAALVRELALGTPAGREAERATRGVVARLAVWAR